MEKVWCGARSKAIKGANTLFAQDSKGNTIVYTCADILRKKVDFKKLLNLSISGDRLKQKYKKQWSSIV